MVRWAAVAIGSKLAVNHTKNTILPRPACGVENPFLQLFLRKLVAIFFYFFSLFLLSPLFFPSQLIRKTLSVTKTHRAADITFMGGGKDGGIGP
jgi:hypothetical protein